MNTNERRSSGRARRKRVRLAKQTDRGQEASSSLDRRTTSVLNCATVGRKSSETFVETARHTSERTLIEPVGRLKPLESGAHSIRSSDAGRRSNANRRPISGPFVWSAHCASLLTLRPRVGRAHCVAWGTARATHWLPPKQTNTVRAPAATQHWI